MLIGLFVETNSQPSGGPYGPIKITYEIPKNKNVFYVSTDGSEFNLGNDINNPTTTIEKHFELLKLATT